MQESEFEKQMQQMMDTLQLEPTDALWQKIQAEISQKQRKKKRFILFFLSAMLFIGGCFVLYNYTTNNDSTKIVSSNKNSKSRNTTNSASESIANTTTLLSNAETNKQPVTDNVRNGETVITTLNATNKESNTTISVTNTSEKKLNNIVREVKYSSTKKNKHTKRKVKFSSTNADIAVIAENTIEEKNDGKDDIYEEALGNKNLLITENNITEKQKADIAKSSILEKSIATVIDKTKVLKVPNNFSLSPTKSKNTNSSNKKWQFAVTASLGISSITAQYPSPSLYNTADVNSSSITPNTNLGGLFSTTYFPSSIPKASFGYSAGINLFRNLNTKTKIGIGLEYQYSSSTILTGDEDSITLINTGRIGILKNNGNMNYKNNFHSLNIPISLITKVAEIKKHEIVLMPQIIFSSLLKTNTMQFDYSRGVFFKDDSYFNKISVGSSLGVFTNLSKNQKTPLYLGPVFNYTFTPISNKGMYFKAHHSYFGFRLTKFL